jgi:hypothetical protein
MPRLLGPVEVDLTTFLATTVDVYADSTDSAGGRHVSGQLSHARERRGRADKLVARVIRYSPDCSTPAVSSIFTSWICSLCPQGML